ncbi:hypothetical protein BU26DRAFT_261800 [Trematosphaeria pertusa]|uniref:Uncharacterized protein n=1 Tax=Trematosphaeria pertusa TaxID=390896 RepID=A0A6A6IRG4_9PLEO|nr:uncharacterized protein BU26DRAFT_261800 [Trematosphaeria pertusa]KAF2252668.1 hypothetical protein BU26DRAFT_261800 [Trematosphaeria pertusa]
MFPKSTDMPSPEQQFPATAAKKDIRGTITGERSALLPGRAIQQQYYPPLFIWTAQYCPSGTSCLSIPGHVHRTLGVNVHDPCTKTTRRRVTPLTQRDTKFALERFDSLLMPFHRALRDTTLMTPRPDPWIAITRGAEKKRYQNAHRTPSQHDSNRT